MASWIGWLLASSAVPAGPLVWVTGGMGTAIALSVLLLVALGVIVWQYEPRRVGSMPQKRLGLPPSAPADSQLPSAA